jgi:hypothetical protein
LRQISAQAQLGKNGQLRTLLFGLFRQAKDARRIPVEIPDCGIELRESYLH